MRRTASRKRAPSPRWKPSRYTAKTREPAVALEVGEVVGDRHVHLVAERDRVARLHDAVEVRDLRDEVGARLADARRRRGPGPSRTGSLCGRDEERVVAAGPGDDAEAVAAVQEHAAVRARGGSRPAPRGCAPSASRPRSVSPKPPAISVTVRARRSSTISCTTASAPRSAATETIARSAGSGSSASGGERPAAVDLGGLRVERPDPLARDAAALDQVAQDDPARVHALGRGADHDRALRQ